MQNLEDLGNQDIEVSLLYSIATYILDREKDQKVRPNIVEPLVRHASENVSRPALANAYGHLEQSHRLVARCLGEQISISAIEDQVLNEQYEEQLAGFFLHHPFLDPTKPVFRNPVFEALALSVLMTAEEEPYTRLVHDYAMLHKSSYHLIYMLDTILRSQASISSTYLSNMVDSAMEFRSVHSSVEIQIDGSHWEEVDDADEGWPLGVSIDLVPKSDGFDREIKAFAFQSKCAVDSVLTLGPRLANVFITLPCTLVIQGETEIEMTGPIAVSAREIRFESPRLVLHSTRGRSADTDTRVVGECEGVSSSLREISTGGCSLQLRVSGSHSIGYPLHQYVQEREPLHRDPELGQKFLRLKRILLEFRSHSRGALARYRGKIDSQRVLKNEIGKTVLDALLRDGIMCVNGNFYFLNSDRLHECLGVSWPELSSGHASETMMDYLRRL